MKMFRAEPWLGIGEIIEHADTSAEVIKLANLDWHVKQAPSYIEVDGVRTYLGDFSAKAKAIKARKEAAEKGVKWYKENRNKLMRNVRRKTKKFKNSKYRDTDRKKTINITDKK